MGANRLTAQRAEGSPTTPTHRKHVPAEPKMQGAWMIPGVFFGRKRFSRIRFAALGNKLGTEGKNRSRMGENP